MNILPRKAGRVSVLTNRPSEQSQERCTRAKRLCARLILWSMDSLSKTVPKVGFLLRKSRLRKIEKGWKLTELKQI